MFQGMKRKYTKSNSMRKGEREWEKAKNKFCGQHCTEDSYSAKILDKYERKTFFLHIISVKKYFFGEKCRLLIIKLHFFNLGVFTHIEQPYTNTFVY
jgi:hypothetical protein